MAIDNKLIDQLLTDYKKPLVVLAGMVAQGIVARRREAWNDF